MPYKEIGYFLYRGNSQLFLIISVMETTTTNTHNTPCSSLITNAPKPKIKTCVNHVEDFSFNLSKRNAFFKNGEN